MEQNYMKRFSYAGLGLSLLMFMIMCILFIAKEKVPGIVMTLFNFGLFICSVSSLIQSKYKFKSKK